jgi:hypothetical protein
LATLQTPDLNTVTNSYDDTSLNAAVTTSSSANQLVSKATLDGLGRTLSQQIFDGLGSTTPVSTQSNVYDVAGFLSKSSNPYPSGGTPVYTLYAHDPLGRVTATAPPPSSAGLAQNSYQATYAGTSSTVSDPTGKQRTLYKDALGRIVRVDEAGLVSGQAALGSLSISGTDQLVYNGLFSNGATAGLASLSIQAVNSTVDGTGSIDRSVPVLMDPATKGSVSMTIGGSDGSQTTTIQTCTGGPPSRFPLTCHTSTTTVADSGSIQFSISAGGTTIGPVSASYSSTSTAAQLASTMFSNFPANSLVSMSNPNGTASFTLTSTAASSAANNYIITVQIVSNCVDSDTVTCTQGWTTSWFA